MKTIACLVGTAEEESLTGGLFQCKGQERGSF